MCGSALSSLLNNKLLPGANALQVRAAAAGPEYGEADCGLVASQSKMHTVLAGGEVASGSSYLSANDPCAEPQFHPRPERVSIGLVPDKLQLQPGTSIAVLIPQQDCGTSAIGNECVHVPVIVVIAKGKSAAYLGCRQRFSALFRIVESPLRILEKQLPLSIGCPFPHDRRIVEYVSVGNQEVEIGVVVKIQKPDAEAHQGTTDEFDAQLGAHILEEAVAQVPIQGQILIMEIGYRDVRAPIPS